MAALAANGRLCAENPRDIDVETVEGAATEQQTVDLALDGAYLEGSYYELQYGTERAACLDWGAPTEGSARSNRRRFGCFLDEPSSLVELSKYSRKARVETVEDAHTEVWLES